MPRKRQTSDHPPKRAKRGRRQDGQAMPPPDPQPDKDKSRQSMETPQYPSHSQLSLPAPLQGTEDQHNLQIPQQHIQTISLPPQQSPPGVQQPAEDEQFIWMFGSSIIKRAHVESLHRPVGTNLNLERIKVSLWWQGYGGLELIKAVNKIKTLRQVGPSPTALLIHCGGNDLGKTSVRKIRLAINQLVHYLRQEFCSAHIIWSLILPRIAWRYTQNTKAMEKARKRINSFIQSRVCEVGGSIIHYPDISDHPQFFQSDGVHLSQLGNQIFLNTLQGGLESIMKFKAQVYPPL
ncbi:uncharacterized protein LOC125675594 isoform X1 [Ostrea edulis]|uniref:uncharacterized protein LOC125675594 isoform X1 n=2 Tax=Ostrea edulis TaxID=37623 RepID=UPI0024AF1902|nr:uncharacterized protein LOC125675594 isoform X1 [Ostrea edulis]